MMTAFTFFQALTYAFNRVNTHYANSG